MVNPDWLRYFLALAETRNFAAAAERLHISPQAMSNAIAGLEAHYGQRLVERDHKMRGLTPAGEALREEAPVILAQMANLERRIAAVASGEPRGRVAIGGPGYVNQYLLPGPLAALVAEFPAIRPALFTLGPEAIEQQVATGELDFGMLMQAPERPDLAWAYGPVCPYVIVARPAAPRPWDAWGYIAPHRDGKHSPDCGSERHLAGPWPESHTRNVVLEVDHIETAIMLAEAGLGAVYVPELAVRTRIAAGHLAVVAAPPAPYQDQLYVVWRKGVRPWPLVSDMLSNLASRS